MAGKKVLGRGLEALISQDLRESVAETERVKELDIQRIDPNPNQPRSRFDPDLLRELSSSIRLHGVLQPVVVRRKGGRYELVVGERRLRAAGMAGRSTIPAIVRDVTDDDSLKYALMENLQREDLNPIEEARGFTTLMEKFGLSAKGIGDILGKDRSTIVNALRLLKLPEEVVSLVEAGKLSAGHARAVLSVEDEKGRIDLALRIVRDGMTVREVERAAPARKRVKARRAGRGTDPGIRAIEERLEMHLGTRVRLTSRRRGGLLSIEYYSNEELERILEKMGVDSTF